MTLSTQTALLESIERFSQDVIETPADEWTPGLVTSRLELLESYWANFAYNHVTLLPLEEAQDSDYIQGNQFARGERAYMACRGRLYDQQDRFKEPAVSCTAQTTAAGNVVQ